MFDIDLVNGNLDYSFEWTEGDSFNPQSLGNDYINKENVNIRNDDG